MSDLKKELEALTETYGPDKMIAVCRSLLNKHKSAEIQVNHEVSAGTLITIENVVHKVADTVLAKVTRVLETSRKAKEVPPAWERLLNPSELLATADQLDAMVNDLIPQETDLYRQKVELLKQVRQLETEVKLKEAEAFMNIPADLKLNNDAMRDAYRRNYSAEVRKKLSGLQAELEGIEIEISHLRADRADFAAASDAVKRKAALQTALLEFLK